MSVPCVDLGPSTATGVEGQLFLSVVTAVESEAVVFAAGSALQLLQQKDDRIMDNTQHARPTHPA